MQLSGAPKIVLKSRLFRNVSENTMQRLNQFVVDKSTHVYRSDHMDTHLVKHNQTIFDFSVRNKKRTRSGKKKSTKSINHEKAQTMAVDKVMSWVIHKPNMTKVRTTVNTLLLDKGPEFYTGQTISTITAFVAKEAQRLQANKKLRSDLGWITQLPNALLYLYKTRISSIIRIFNESGQLNGDHFKQGTKLNGNQCKDLTTFFLFVVVSDLKYRIKVNKVKGYVSAHKAALKKQRAPAQLPCGFDLTPPQTPPDQSSNPFP